MNYYIIIGIREKKMETTILYAGMQAILASGACRGSKPQAIGAVWGVVGFGFLVGNPYHLGQTVS